MARRTACITRWWTPSGTAALDKMMDFINNFVAEIRALAKKIAGKNPEVRAMLEHEADWGADILRAYDQLMEKAGKREAQQRGNGQARKENEQARYSTKAQDQLVEDKYFQRAIDAWDGTSNGGRVKIGVISEGGIYEGVGLPNGVLYMDYSKLAKALSKHGDHLNNNILKQIPQMLASPVVITQPINPQVKNTVNVFGDLMGDNGKPIMVSIMMRPNYAKTGLEAVIRTVEMRSDDKKLITPQSLLYANPNKKRTHEWLLRLGNSSVPFAVSHPGVIRSITYESKSSNVQGENSLNEADTQGGQKPLQFSLRNVDEDMAEMQRMMEENERLRELVGKLNDTLSAERGNGKHIDRKAVLRNVDEDMAEMQRMMEENERLRELVGKLNDTLSAERGNGKHIDRKAVRKIAREDMAEMQRMMEENERLRELVGKLNDTLSAERGNGKHIDRKAVRKIARKMKKEYQSTVSVDDLAANLQKAFDAMASAQSTGDAESVHSTAMQNRSSVLSFPPKQTTPAAHPPRCGLSFSPSLPLLRQQLMHRRLDRRQNFLAVYVISVSAQNVHHIRQLFIPMVRAIQLLRRKDQRAGQRRQIGLLLLRGSVVRALIQGTSRPVISAAARAMTACRIGVRSMAAASVVSASAGQTIIIKQPAITIQTAFRFMNIPPFVTLMSLSLKCYRPTTLSSAEMICSTITRGTCTMSAPSGVACGYSGASVSSSPSG